MLGKLLLELVLELDKLLVNVANADVAKEEFEGALGALAQSPDAALVDVVFVALCRLKGSEVALLLPLHLRKEVSGDGRHAVWNADAERGVAKLCRDKAVRLEELVEGVNNAVRLRDHAKGEVLKVVLLQNLDGRVLVGRGGSLARDQEDGVLTVLLHVALNKVARVAWAARVNALDLHNAGEVENVGGEVVWPLQLNHNLVSQGHAQEVAVLVSLVLHQARGALLDGFAQERHGHVVKQHIGDAAGVLSRVSLAAHGDALAGCDVEDVDAGQVRFAMCHPDEGRDTGAEGVVDGEEGDAEEALQGEALADVLRADGDDARPDVLLEEPAHSTCQQRVHEHGLDLIKRLQDVVPGVVVVVVVVVVAVVVVVIVVVAVVVVVIVVVVVVDRVVMVKAGSKTIDVVVC